MQPVEKSLFCLTMTPRLRQLYGSSAFRRCLGDSENGATSLRPDTCQAVVNSKPVTHKPIRDEWTGGLLGLKLYRPCRLYCRDKSLIDQHSVLSSFSILHLFSVSFPPFSVPRFLLILLIPTFWTILPVIPMALQRSQMHKLRGGMIVSRHGVQFLLTYTDTFILFLFDSHYIYSALRGDTMCHINSLMHARISMRICFCI